MNQEQLKSTLRTFIAMFGGAIAGWAAHSGWITADQVLAILNSETFLGLAVAVAGGVWGLFVHKQSNAVAIVAAMKKDPESPVKGVVVEPTEAGRKLVKEIDGSAVVAAGTPQAKDLAMGHVG